MGGRTALRRALVGGTTLTLAVLVGWSWLAKAGALSNDAPQTKAGARGPLPEADQTAMAQRFAHEVWPLLTRAQASCVACHTKDNPSQLHFPADAQGSFQMLLADGRLDAGSASALLARVSSKDPAQQMPPPGMPGWSEADKAVLRRFVQDLTAKRPPLSADGPKPDEVFPAMLRTPYRGTAPAEGEDNTFLTYFQLKRKVQTLFGDDWNRDGHDLFEENLAQFGGADFEHRFDETTRPTAAYLSAAGAMAADVAARAYLNKTGPFAGRPDALPTPGVQMDAANKAEIVRLYQRLLYRTPSSAELQEAFALLRAISQAPKQLAGQTDPLIFALDAADENGLHTTRQVEIQTVPAGHGLTLTYVNQNTAQEDTWTLPGTFTLKPGDPAQHLELSNRDTSGHVSFKSVTLRGPLPAKSTRVITSAGPTVRAEGAWHAYGDRAADGYDDDDNNKGHSRLIVPLTVPAPGRYQIAVSWRRHDPPSAEELARMQAAAQAAKAQKKKYRGKADVGGAECVPVVVTSHDASRLALPPTAPVPPKGEAEFTIDQTEDTRQYLDLQTAFRFGDGARDGVEIANAGTRRRVVADAVSFVPAADPLGKPAAVVTCDEARGHADWPVYKPSDTVYNTIGPNLRSDENARKGGLRLLFAPPAALTRTGYFRARVTYPGHVDNETQVPVTVYASQSSPIVRLRAPFVAPVGAAVTLDASASYNVQHTPLRCTWTQIGGPQVTLADPHAPVLHFTVPVLRPQQAAWQGLCRALILHPDFLFTRPRSQATTYDAPTRRRLLLVKLAQDLVGRPPTPAEVALLDRGAPLTQMTDRYLAAPEFEDYYYRRVRLYLESHGTPTQDEPARLWRYLLHTDRPYTELMTADYTITPDGRKQSRPAYCGHTGVLTMKGFLEGKPGLPHFNYAAQVCQKFLGYVFEVTPEVVKARGTLTAASTTDPHSLCYSCHQILTPLAYQRSRWTDDGEYQTKDDGGHPIDDSDRGAVATYAFKGEGLQAFALACQRKERFHRAIMQTHFLWYFGREMRWDADERGLYQRLWNEAHRDKFSLRRLVRALVTSPEYLGTAKPGVSLPVSQTAHR